VQLVDSRRLRGPNLQVMGAAAVAEVSLDPGDDPDAATRAWRQALDRLAAALGVAGAAHAVARPFPGGICFVLPAPIDILYAATEINEWAIAIAAAELASRVHDETFEDACARIAAEIEEESRPGLLELEQAARAHHVAFLWDDERVTVGMAARARTYPIEELPAPDEVPWAELGRIPVVLVTGTNGKTTSTRLIARMVLEAGRSVGNTSTDGIAVNGVVVEPGDWTGAEAARQLLRRDDIELAVLETARGGILRRGLAIDHADAALMLNVSADHLGEFGVHDLPTMAKAKAVVGQVVAPPGHVVLNADDEHLRALAGSFKAPVILFSLDAANPMLASHRAAGGIVLFARDGALWRGDVSREHRIVEIDRITIAFGGIAQYNVANALGAAAIGWSLGLPDAAITRALEQFDAADNPGRGQLVERPGGVRALVDFGHNPVALHGVLALARALQQSEAGERAGKLVVATTQAGDRDHAALARHAAAIADARPALVLVWETPHLRRGRAPGETAEILGRELRQRGIAVEVAESEVAALQQGLSRADAGDIVVVSPCIDRTGVASLLDT
jgi:UDP-N-acetylmuramyl tripeptide synthase